MNMMKSTANIQPYLETLLMLQSVLQSRQECERYIHVNQSTSDSFEYDNLLVISCVTASWDLAGYVII